MIYRALKNFRIDKWVVLAGDIYSGGAVDHLLKLGLIKSEGPQLSTTTDVSETSGEVPPPSEKKSKKKKG